jgi:hypothetical protein
MKLVLAMLALFFLAGFWVRRITGWTMAWLLLGIGVILMLTRLTF